MGRLNRRSRGSEAHNTAWAEIGPELEALDRRLRVKAAKARATARTARRRRHLAKWDKFNSLARVYEAVRRDLDRLGAAI